MKTTVIGSSQAEREFINEYIRKLSDNDPVYFLLNEVNNNLIYQSNLLLISADNYDSEQFLIISRQLRNIPADTVTILYGTDISKTVLTELCPVDGFLLLNSKRSLPGSDTADRLRVKIFGKFEIFKNEKTINFKNRKSKELLALCIDRKGKKISSDDAAEILWSERMKSSNVSQLYRKAARDLTRTLSAEGFDEVFMRAYGKCWVNMSRISCDMFRFIADPENYLSLNGEYFSEYRWAKRTRDKINVFINISKNSSDNNTKNLRSILDSLLMP